MCKRLLSLFVLLIVALSFSLPAYAVTEYVVYNDRQTIALAYFGNSYVTPFNSFNLDEFSSSYLNYFTGKTVSVKYGDSSYTCHGGFASFPTYTSLIYCLNVYLPYGGIVDVFLPASYSVDAIMYFSGSTYYVDSEKIYYGRNSGTCSMSIDSVFYDVSCYSITVENQCSQIAIQLTAPESLQSSSGYSLYAYMGINAFAPSGSDVDLSGVETVLDNICALLENEISVDLDYLKKYTYSIYDSIDDIESFASTIRTKFQYDLSKADYSSALSYAAVVDTLYDRYLSLSKTAENYFQLAIIKDYFDIYLTKAENEYSKLLSEEYQISDDDVDALDSYSELQRQALDSFSLAQFESLTAFDQYLLKLDTEQVSFLRQIYDLIISSSLGQAFVFVPLSFSLMAIVLGAPIRSIVRQSRSGD